MKHRTILKNNGGEWITNPQTVVESVMNECMLQACGGSDCPQDIVNQIFDHYRSGYCWHFAHTLLDTFERGTVCWTAPQPHMVWVDTDNIPYDISGMYHDCNTFYYIPEKYLGDFAKTFRHISYLYDMGHTVDRKTLIKLMKNHCRRNHIKYDPQVEWLF